MVKKAQIGTTILGIVAMAAMLAGFVATIWLIAYAIRHGATAVAATLAALATVGSALIFRYFERRTKIEAVRREMLGKIYEDLASVQAGHEIPQRRIVKLIPDFFKKGLLYASPDLLKAYREWRDALPEREDEFTRADALRYENFIKAMRADLGVSNFGLQDGDLARTVLRDFDQEYPAPGIAGDDEPMDPPIGLAA
jgi:hypothetical protein